MPILTLLALALPATAAPLRAETVELIDAECIDLIDEAPAAITPPFLACGELGLAWDGAACVNLDGSPAEDLANLIAAGHNATLVNDLVRGDDRITDEDLAPFLQTAFEALCATEGCDADALTAELTEVYAPRLADGFDPIDDIGGLLEENVANGAMSPALGEALLAQLQERPRSPWTADGGLAGLDDTLASGDWDEVDQTTVDIVRATAHASASLWGTLDGDDLIEAAKIDASAAGAEYNRCMHHEKRWCRVKSIASGAFASARYLVFADQSRTLPALSWGEIAAPIAFEESFLLDGALFTLEGDLHADGGELRIRDESGQILAAQRVAPDTLDVDLTDSDSAARGLECITIYVWTPWGTYSIRVCVDIKKLISFH